MLEAEIAHNLAAAEVVLVELVLMLMDQMEEMEEPVFLMTSQVVHNIMRLVELEVLMLVTVVLEDQV
jgi:hypothetical protein